MTGCAICNAPVPERNDEFCSRTCASIDQRGVRDPARLARFVELQNAGLNPREIALQYYEETGEITTRNMVIGQLNRLRNGRQYMMNANARRREERARQRREMERRQAELAALERGHLSLEQLTSRTCRWPYGERPDASFCGAECNPNVPYCGPHMAAAYQEDSSLNRRKRHPGKHSKLTGGFR